jgi:hypothetical protein
MSIVQELNYLFPIVDEGLDHGTFVPTPIFEMHQHEERRARELYFSLRESSARGFEVNIFDEMEYEEIIGGWSEKRLDNFFMILFP